MMSNNKKYDNIYRVSMYLPNDLEDKARNKAFDIGMVKGGRGMLSAYIQKLIYDDLRLRPKYKNVTASGMVDAITKRVNITLDRDFQQIAQERAKELGFVKDNVGNVSGYIRYLLSID